MIEILFYVKEKTSIFEAKNKPWRHDCRAAMTPKSHNTMKHVFIFLLIFLTSVSAAAVRDEFSVNYLGVESGLSNNHVVGITQDKQGFIWIATDEGLNRFDGHNFKTYFKDEIAKSSSVTGNELNGIIDDPRTLPDASRIRGDMIMKRGSSFLIGILMMIRHLLPLMMSLP